MKVAIAASNRGRLWIAAAYAVTVLTVGVFGIVASLRWIDRPFPGFFLMPNAVVPSVALGHWSGAAPDPIFQRHVVAVDGHPVADARAIYDRVAETPVGHEFVYTLDDGAGAAVRRIRSMRFTARDYGWFFGPLLLNGVVFTVVGLFIWILGRPSPSTIGATLFTLDIGLFCLTAMDLYGPGTLFRVHAATEAFVAATLLHLALIFPVARLGHRRQAMTILIYLADVVLIALSERHLYTPGVYSWVHNLCMTLWGITCACFIGSAVHAYVTTAVPLVRRRLGVIALGLVIGFALPAWVLTWSGIVGGEVPINVAAFTAFLFPLSLAYAVVKHDLFEIDALIRRGVSYLILTGIVAAAYTLLVLACGVLLQTADLARSPVLPVTFSVLMIVFFNPLRARLQDGVDRVFDRRSYDPQRTLAHASTALVGTLDLDDIYTIAIDTPARALLVDAASLWMSTPDGGCAAVRRRGESHGSPGPFPGDHEVVQRLRDVNRPLTAYDHDADERETAEARIDRRVLDDLGAELVIPIGARDLAGFLALGVKRSGTLFTLRDLEFLRTFTNQVAVAVQNARSYRQVEDLNAGLEQTVAQRTSELAATNHELANSIRELERAYDEMQRRQEELVRAERLAALGRLTAGIAHEVNTPLGASLNALKLGGELVEEYTHSIGDAAVTPDDHREIATELRAVLTNVQRWTTTAAGYIRSIKSHTRSLREDEPRLFDVSHLIEDTRVLLSHRLRLSSCAMTVDGAAGVMLHGDPGRLGQVLTNLVVNAIDAYDGRSADGAVIRVRVAATAQHVEIAVEDDGCGIAPEHMQRLFEELFTTKPPGKGTGLGLSICRDIVADCFDGHIDVRSSPGHGSRFTLVLPRRQLAEADDKPLVSEAV